MPFFVPHALLAITDFLRRLDTSTASDSYFHTCLGAQRKHYKVGQVFLDLSTNKAFHLGLH